MKRLALVLAILALISGSGWAGVRLDWDDSTNSETGKNGLSVAAGETGGSTSTLVLGEVVLGTQTPSLTFSLSGNGIDAVQSPSLSVDLTISHVVAKTLDVITFEASGTISTLDAIAIYEWDVDGDGVFADSTTAPVFEHVYKDNGSYFAQVRVTDMSGQTAVSESVRVVVENRIPSAAFGISTDITAEGAAVQFEDHSRDDDGRIVSWIYDFGDGSTSSEPHPTHTYAEAGIYDVTLTVTDDDGARSQSSLEVKVSNRAPVASFTVIQSALRVGEQLVVVDASTDPSTDGRIVHIAWDFGDGSYLAGGPSLDGRYTHTFSAPGTYTIHLYVIDNDGSLARAQSTVQVL